MQSNFLFSEKLVHLKMQQKQRATVWVLITTFDAVQT